MYELLIVRHAIAHERDASLWPNDEERPLTKEGIDKFRQAARGLERVVDAPEELLCSPLTRARQTAAILEEKAAFPRAIELDRSCVRSCRRGSCARSHERTKQ